MASFKLFGAAFDLVDGVRHAGIRADSAARRLFVGARLCVGARPGCVLSSERQSQNRSFGACESMTVQRGRVDAGGSRLPTRPRRAHR